MSSTTQTDLIVVLEDSPSEESSVVAIVEAGSVDVDELIERFRADAKRAGLRVYNEDCGDDWDVDYRTEPWQVGKMYFRTEGDL